MKKTLLKKLLSLTIVITLLAMPLTGCVSTSSSTTATATHECFNTVVTLTINSCSGDESADDIINECFGLCYNYEKLFSRTKDSSDVSAINNSNGQPVEVKPVVAELIEDSIYYSELSNGAFDITIYPVMELWGFTTKNYRVPESSEIAEVLKHVSYTNVGINGQQVTLSDGASIDLGGIAKGYTSSRVIQIMKDCGIEHAIVNLGGNVQVLGRKSDGSDWRVAIQNPDSESSYLGVLSTADKAVITSGGYERYFEQDGQVYHHIIDPQTGYPSESDLTSVTIVCSDGTTADALSTALFVMGLDGAKELYRSGSLDFEMILYDGSRVYVSEGIADSFSTNMNTEIITIQP